MKPISLRTSALVAQKLKKFAKVAKLAQAYAADIPLWSTIIFEPERTLYLGWRFQVEAPPVLPVDQTVMVNFDQFSTAMGLLQNEVDIVITDDNVTIHEQDDDGATFELKRSYIDLTNFMITPPEDLELRKAHGNMLEDIKWAIIGSTRDRMDYTKYGVILDKNYMMAMDTTSAVAFIDKPTMVDIPVLLHLPWCNVLSDLGEIEKIGQWDEGNQNAYLQLATEGGFILTIPTLKVNPNPTVEAYVKSFEKHMTVYVDALTVKQLLVTTDDAYKFATIYTEDDWVYLETTSNAKGKTTICVHQGKDLGTDTVSVSLDSLKKVSKLTGRMYIDLDNMVGYVQKDKYTYGFGLG